MSNMTIKEALEAIELRCMEVAQTCEVTPSNEPLLDFINGLSRTLGHVSKGLMPYAELEETEVDLIADMLGRECENVEAAIQCFRETGEFEDANDHEETLKWVDSLWRKFVRLNSEEESA